MNFLISAITVLSVVVLGLQLFTTWNLFRSIKRSGFPAPKLLRIAWGFLQLLFLLYPIFTVGRTFFTGNTDIYDQPRWMIYSFWFGLGFLAQYVAWALVFELARWSAARYSKLPKVIVNQLHMYTLLGLIVIIGLYTGVKMYLDTNKTQIEQITHTIPDLPDELDGLTIAHISDVQADQFTGQTELLTYVERVNDLRPDLVVFTGDLVTWGDDYVAMGAEIMGRLRSRYGVYGVLGDHDIWAGVDTVLTSLRAQGITMLTNENHWIEADSARIKVTGITHAYDQRINRDQLKEVLWAKPYGDLQLLVSHQVNEEIVYEADTFQYHLITAGHTHGGQVQLPVIGALVGPPHGLRYISGLYELEGMFLYVNRGLGTIRLPLRFNCPPEVTVITLRSAAG